MENQNNIEQGLLEKEENAKKLRLKKLKSIGISSEEELESILFDEKFNLENRLSEFKDTKNYKENILTHISEDEKCEKLKAYEKMIKEEFSILDNLKEEKPFYAINKTGRTIYTDSGQPLYNKEVCVRFPYGGRVYMMRTDGSMGIEYLSSTDSSEGNFRRLNDMLWTGYGHLISRANVRLFDYNASYIGYTPASNMFKGGGMWVLSSNPLLISIMDYTKNGKWYYNFDGFLETNLNMATHMDRLNVYGDPNRF